MEMFEQVRWCVGSLLRLYTFDTLSSHSCLLKEGTGKVFKASCAVACELLLRLKNKTTTSSSIFGESSMFLECSNAREKGVSIHICLSHTHTFISYAISSVMAASTPAPMIPPSFASLSVTCLEAFAAEPSSTRISIHC